MFTNQLLENAKDELSFRTVVRDLQTKSAMLQIILLNPSSWCCYGYCLGIDNATESAAKVDLFPAIKLLFSDCSSSTKSQSRLVCIMYSASFTFLSLVGGRDFVSFTCYRV